MLSVSGTSLLSKNGFSLCRMFSEPIKPQEPVTKPTPTVEELTKEIETMKNRNLFLIAEVENARRRFERLIQENEITAVTNLAKQLLPVADNITRVINGGTKQNVKSVLEAVKLIDSEFHHVFKQFKIEKLVSNGKPFDPKYHDAIQLIDTKGKSPSGSVIDVPVEGYIIDSKLLRAAKVVVAK